MANEFDPYREALVIETETIWPDELDDVDAATKAKVESRLHSEPQQAAQLEYARLHTGFARKITVTSADVERTS
ncbi:MAG: hypothetical protein KF708_15575 [Pirellulales bacterium]|nr:hypothetical protein [Pirellulales bacterium]